MTESLSTYELAQRIPHIALACWLDAPANIFPPPVGNRSIPCTCLTIREGIAEALMGQGVVFKAGAGSLALIPSPTGEPPIDFPVSTRGEPLRKPRVDLKSRGKPVKTSKPRLPVS